MNFCYFALGTKVLKKGYGVMRPRVQYTSGDTSDPKVSFEQRNSRVSFGKELEIKLGSSRCLCRVEKEL